MRKLIAWLLRRRDVGHIVSLQWIAFEVARGVLSWFEERNLRLVLKEHTTTPKTLHVVAAIPHDLIGDEINAEEYDNLQERWLKPASVALAAAIQKRDHLCLVRLPNPAGDHWVRVESKRNGVSLLCQMANVRPGVGVRFEVLSDA